MGLADRHRVIQRAKRILRREVAGLLHMISHEDKRRQALEVYKKASSSGLSIESSATKIVFVALDSILGCWNAILTIPLAPIDYFKVNNAVATRKSMCQLFALPEYKNARRISCYISSGLEMDTGPIFTHAFKNDKMCFVPRYSFRHRKMDMVRVLDLHDLKIIKSKQCHNVYNVKYSEIRDDALKTGGLDLIIVSGLAFTKEGKRLGSGGGYYDDYLKALYDDFKLHPKTVALAYEEQLFPYLPTHRRDISIDIVISPLYSTKRSITVQNIFFGSNKKTN